MSNYYNDQWRLPNNENKDKQSNYSMDFDGSQKITLNSSIQLTTNKSISVWVYVEPTVNQNTLLGGDAFPIYYFWLDNPNSKIYIRDNTAITQLSTGTLSEGWTHFCITGDGTTATLYVNGVSTSTGTDRELDIRAIGGYVTGSSYFFNGKADAVSIFNYALTDGTGGTVNQIAALYGSSSTGIGNPMSLSPAPVAYYPLGDQDAFNGADYLVPNSSLKDYVFDYLTTNSYIDTNFTLPAYTSYSYSIWYKQTSSFTGDNYLIGNLPQGSGSIADMRVSVRFNGGTKLRFLTGNDTTSFQSTDLDVSSLLLDGNWHHISIIVVSGEIKLYIDSNLENTYSNANIVTGISANRSYALGFSGNTQYAGYLDNSQLSNFQIFNTALPATGSNSIETLYNNGSPLTSMSGFTSLQGSWKLDASATYDGTDWSIPDDSSNSNDGTSSGMTQSALQQSDLQYTSGYSPYALDFSGTDQYISCSSSTIFQNTSNFSVSFWVNMDDYSGGGCVLMAANGGSNIFHIYAYGGNTIQVRLRKDGLGNGLISNVDLNNKWSNICLVYDGTKTGNSNRLKFYINKVEQTISFNQDIQSSINIGGDFLIGQQSGQSSIYTIDGQLSNISLWNNSLTASQVTEIYSEGKPSNLNNHSAVSSLISWWQLGSNSSFNTNWTVLDEKGSNNGTSVNMTEVDIVDGVGSYANGLSSGMGGDEIVGDAFGSSANSLSVNMDVLDRTTDTPS